MRLAPSSTPVLRSIYEFLTVVFIEAGLYEMLQMSLDLGRHDGRYKLREKTDGLKNHCSGPSCTQLY